jgi:predicted MFS family arabinose efflux permease
MLAPRVLRASDYRDLLVAETVSALGDWIGTVAFISLVFAITKSPTAVGGMLTLRLAPALVAGPVAARVVVRWNPRRTMMGMNAVRAGIVAVIPFVHTLWWVFFWAFFLEMCSLVFLPARDASILHLIEERHEDLALANGLLLGSSYGTLPVGAGMFAAVSALAGGPLRWFPEGRFGLAFWLDATTFLVGFALLARITSLRGIHVGAQGSGDTGPDEAGGFLRALRLPLIRATLPPVLAAAAGLGSLFSLGIEFVRSTLHASDTQFGCLIILFGVGAAAGMAVLQVRRPREPMRVLRPGVTIIGGVLAGMALAPDTAVAFGGAVLFGAACSYSMISGMTGVQTALDDDTDRQLAFAAIHVGLRLALVIGAIGAGVASQLVKGLHAPVIGTLDPPRVVLFFSGLVVVVGAWIFSGPMEALIPPAEPTAPTGAPLQSGAGAYP